eukprot:scaffold44599_cov42-Attheya_sp.AAC.3
MIESLLGLFCNQYLRRTAAWLSLDPLRRVACNVVSSLQSAGFFFPSRRFTFDEMSGMGSFDPSGAVRSNAGINVQFGAILSKLSRTHVATKSFVPDTEVERDVIKRGGKRCHIPECGKMAVGRSTLCTGHGGGRRCQETDCAKSAQSNTNFCVRHGGGRKCTTQGCTKAARGRSELCMSHRSTVDI